MFIKTRNISKLNQRQSQSTGELSAQLKVIITTIGFERNLKAANHALVALSLGGCDNRLIIRCDLQKSTYLLQTNYMQYLAQANEIGSKKTCTTHQRVRYKQPSPLRDK